MFAVFVVTSGICCRDGLLLVRCFDKLPVSQWPDLHWASWVAAADDDDDDELWTVFMRTDIHAHTYSQLLLLLTVSLVRSKSPRTQCWDELLLHAPGHTTKSALNVKQCCTTFSPWPRLQDVYSSSWEPIPALRRVTCHIYVTHIYIYIYIYYIYTATQHRWTHPTLIPARQAGTRFTYPWGMESCTYCQKTVQTVQPTTLSAKESTVH